MKKVLFLGLMTLGFVGLNASTPAVLNGYKACLKPCYGSCAQSGIACQSAWVHPACVASCNAKYNIQNQPGIVITK